MGRVRRRISAMCDQRELTPTAANGCGPGHIHTFGYSLLRKPEPAPGM